MQTIQTSARRALLAGGSAVLALMAMPAFAQDAAPAADATYEIPGDIVVTARKSEERLQDVPITITALTGDVMKAKDVRGLTELYKLTPGLNFEDIGSRQSPRLQMRGLSTSATGGSKVSVFVDGMYIGADFSAISFADLERVEVLKGPQSAVFGRSTFSGAINYVTRTPTSQYKGNITGTLASRGEKELTGYLSGPIIGDTLLGMVSGRYFDYNGPDSWKNQQDGQRIGSNHTGAGSAKLVLNAAPSLKFTAYGAYQEDRDGQDAVYIYQAGQRQNVATRANGSIGHYLLGSVNAPRDPNFNYSLSQMGEEAGFKRKSFRGYFRTDWNVLNHDIAITYGHENERKHAAEESDYTSQLVQYFIQNQHINNDTLEVRISSDTSKPFRYAFGVYGADLKTLSDFNPFYFGGARLHLGTLSLVKSRSVFGSLNYDVTEQITVTAEGRYQSEEITSLNTVTNLRFNDTFKAFLPRINVAYKPVSNVTLYALYAKGNNPGGFNSSTFATADQRIIEEEKIDNYEAGIKTVLMGGKVRFNAAVYHMKWTNQQNNDILTTSTGIGYSVTLNKGSSRVNGFEMEASVTPTRGLNFRATASYNDAKYSKFCSLNYGLLLTGVSTCVDVSGNTLEAQPPIQVSFGGDYTYDISDTLALFARSSVSLTDKKYDSEMNLAYAPSAVILDSQIGVKIGDATIEIFCRNCTDNRSFSRITRFSLPGALATTGSADNQTIVAAFRKPRQIGVKASFGF